MHGPWTRPAPVALLVLLGCVGCNSLAPTTDNGPLERGAAIPILLSVETEDSLRLRCDGAAAPDSAWHWLDPGSLVRLEPDGSATVSLLVADLPPSRLGAPRCGGEEGVRGLRRPGFYSVRSDDVVAFDWDEVERPDTAGLWVTSEEVWVSDGLPVSGRELSAVVRFEGVEIPAILGFPIEGGP